ncbi:hypothetical protein RKD28_001034 [Streptomyces sp. SAI-229]
MRRHPDRRQQRRDCLHPTNSYWLKRIKAQFTALRCFTLDGTDRTGHKEQGSMIRRYIIRRNRQADDRRLHTIADRANVSAANSGLFSSVITSTAAGSAALGVGPEAERRFGKRHFIELTASFTAPPQFTVVSGRTETDRTDPSVLTEERPGPRRLLLGGRSWQVTYIDWTRKRVFVEPADGGGVAKWMNGGIAGLSYALTRAMREVLPGADPPVSLTRRAEACLTEQRETEALDTVHPGGTLITRVGSDVRWWTWAGYRANAPLGVTLPSIADPLQRPTDCWLRLREDLTPAPTGAARENVGESLVLPDVDPRAVRGLKFSTALPERLAVATVAVRLADFESARAVLGEPMRFQYSG